MGHRLICVAPCIQTGYPPRFCIQTVGRYVVALDKGQDTLGGAGGGQPVFTVWAASSVARITLLECRPAWPFPQVSNAQSPSPSLPFSLSLPVTQRHMRPLALMSLSLCLDHVGSAPQQLAAAIALLLGRLPSHAP